jgi:hypothetical protein
MTFGGRHRYGRSSLCALVVMLTYAVALGVPSNSIGTVPLCMTGQLHHLVSAGPRGRQGDEIILFRAFTNTGNAACLLHGYPVSVVLLSQAGMPIGTHARVARRAGHPHEIRLTRLGLAYFRLYIKDGAVCRGHSFTFYGLTVHAVHAPAGTPTHLTERFPGVDACDFSAHVTPLLAHANG